MSGESRTHEKVLIEAGKLSVQDLWQSLMLKFNGEDKYPGLFEHNLVSLISAKVNEMTLEETEDLLIKATALPEVVSESLKTETARALLRLIRFLMTHHEALRNSGAKKR